MSSGNEGELLPAYNYGRCRCQSEMKGGTSQLVGENRAPNSGGSTSVSNRREALPAAWLEANSPEGNTYYYTAPGTSTCEHPVSSGGNVCNSEGETISPADSVLCRNHAIAPSALGSPDGIVGGSVRTHTDDRLYHANNVSRTSTSSSAVTSAVSPVACGSGSGSGSGELPELSANSSSDNRTNDVGRTWSMTGSMTLEEPPPGGGGVIGDEESEKLPDGWSVRISPYGHTYYADSFTRTTTWIRPVRFSFVSCTPGFPHLAEFQMS